MSAILPIDNIETKYSLHRGEDCMKKIYSSLRQHTTNAINFEKKKMLLLTKKELILHQDDLAEGIHKIKCKDCDSILEC